MNRLPGSAATDGWRELCGPVLIAGRCAAEIAAARTSRPGAHSIGTKDDYVLATALPLALDTIDQIRATRIVRMVVDIGPDS